MERSFSVAQVTGAIPGGNPTPPHVVSLTKPDSNQAVTLQLDGAVLIDLSSIANMPVTFVHVGDRLVILFDNRATVTLEPFFNGDGTPLSTISVELAPDRSVTGAEFASLFPITQDQSVLPTAGNGAPPSGADFQTVTIDQLLNTTTPLGPLNSDSPNGNAPGPTGNDNVAINSPVQGPTLTVHGAAGNEDKPIGLSISDALSIADPRASLGNITIAGIPAGVTFNHGSLSADGKTLTVTPAQLAGLALTSDGEAQHFNLTVTATTVDNGNTASTTATLHVDVTPVADTPILAVTNASGNEDHAIALNIQPALAEADADAVQTVTITGIPAGVTFNQGTLSPDGKTLTLTPAQLAGLTLTSDGEVQHFNLTVTATTVDGGDTATAASVSKTLHVDVTPVADAPVLIAAAAASSVNEAGTVALNIATQAEPDGDAVTTVTISGLGTATLSAGHVNPDGSVTLQQSDLEGLTLHAADDDTASLHLRVTASTNDSRSIATSVAQTIDLAVNPVAEAPILDLPRNPSPLDVPNAFALGINNSGTIVGEFVDQSGNTHGFVDQGGSPVTLDVPNSTFTAAFSVNAAGDVAGFFDDQSGDEHGFVDHAGTFTQIDFIDSKGNVAPLTDVLGINDSGEVVGQFIDSNNRLHGFSEQGGVFTQIDVPGAKATDPFGVNDAGEIVGFFQ